MASLNFSKHKFVVKQYLSNFTSKSVNNEYVELCVSIGDAVVTLYKSGKVVVGGSAEHRLAVEEKLKSLVESKVSIGIDEVGRGEGDGPFVFCGVLGDESKLLSLRDSKKTTDISQAAKLASKDSKAYIAVHLSAEYVDELRGRGISLNAMSKGVCEGIAATFRILGESGELVVDGSRLPGLEARFVVKGDDTEPVVSAASVIAKRIRNDSGDKALRKSWASYKKN